MIFDIIVVGGGHAGVEAVTASAKLANSVCLITFDHKHVASLPCNPAVGGIGKSQLVREIDALGGLMAKAADANCLQSRVLNLQKGPAVHSTRVQVDNVAYPMWVQLALSKFKNLTILEGEVADLIVHGSTVKGVTLTNGSNLLGKAVILATGTFLNGKLFTGLEQTVGGRTQAPSSCKLAFRLRELTSKVGRLKTGTPPRLKRKSIDFSRLIIQSSDEPLPKLSFQFEGKITSAFKSEACFITETNSLSHSLVARSLEKSPLFSGKIVGIGPRYCPSIEDKVYRFPAKSSHQIFLEPESAFSDLIYPNGISTSLPLATQHELVQSILGLEKAEIVRPGYAVEYDYLNPIDLHRSLAHKELKALFLAGQINGTTGYEEAAAQGLIAGINAALYVNGKEAWVPTRNESYLGVLLDDLTSLGTTEPYRMFTSRAEYRLSLREDNADQRLMPIAKELNLISNLCWETFQAKQDRLHSERLNLSKAKINVCIDSDNLSIQADQYLKRPEVSYKDLVDLGYESSVALNTADAKTLEVEIKYEGYISRQAREALRLKKYEIMKLPSTCKYESIAGLSNEVVEKLNFYRPDTLGQASRIPGITPAALSLLIIYLKRTYGFKEFFVETSA